MQYLPGVLYFSGSSLNTTIPSFWLIDANISPDLIMSNMYFSASCGPFKCTLFATSANDSVKNVCVNRWMFFLYNDAATCFTRPKLTSRTNTSRCLMMTLWTSSLCDVSYAEARSMYAWLRGFTNREITCDEYFGILLIFPSKINDTKMYFLYDSSIMYDMASAGVEIATSKKYKARS